jgi:hypothetical protein
MSAGILEKVDEQLTKYRETHHGGQPLYILVSSEEEDALREAVRKVNGLKQGDIVTTYKESKILRHDILKEGEMLLTDDLPGD